MRYICNLTTIIVQFSSTFYTTALNKTVYLKLMNYENKTNSKEFCLLWIEDELNLLKTSYCREITMNTILLTS